MKVEPTSAQTSVSDNPVQEIPLAGPVADRHAELSGLAWYGDQLILLPQFPDFNGGKDAQVLYSLSKDEILAYLDGQSDQPLEPRPVPFAAPGLERSIRGFEGYEAIAFVGDEAYLTIEAQSKDVMHGYLVKGAMAPDLGGLSLDTSTLAAITPQTDTWNIAEETLFVAGQTVGVLHELNGPRINPAPIAHLFDLSLAPAGTTPFPNVPFRITDATALDADGRFWAINYFYPGSGEVLDWLGLRRDATSQDQNWPAWEGLGRLLEFQFSPEGITSAGTAPIQLESKPGDIRNWEGLARLDDRGFLLVSDKWPGTALGFVPQPAAD